MSMLDLGFKDHSHYAKQCPICGAWLVYPDKNKTARCLNCKNNFASYENLC